MCKVRELYTQEMELTYQINNLIKELFEIPLYETSYKDLMNKSKEKQEQIALLTKQKFDIAVSIVNA